jgi:magnesium chelatase family protein
MFVKIKTLSIVGLDPKEITVEVDIHGSMPKFEIVGLAGKAVQESKERVFSAIKNSGFTFPNKHIIVNLAPADIPKNGPYFDLPIALGIILASESVKMTETIEDFLDKSIFLGELSLSGECKHINGALSVSDYCSKHSLDLYIPSVNAKEASIVPTTNIVSINSLIDLADIISSKQPKEYFSDKYEVSFEEEDISFEFDFAHIKGQKQVKRAAEIAAAGGHNLLLSGTPGSGKSMVAKAFPSILPMLNFEEAFEVTRLYSIAGLLEKENPIIKVRPFRKPHHTSSQVSLIGGGSYPKPGEISLSHRGVLFLDEFPEFSTLALESLRQPLEDKIVTISRATGSLTFPANFMLIAAQNPCRCGWKGDPEKQCTCTAIEVLRYQKKISGPIMDRIDLQVWVPRVKIDSLMENRVEESSLDVRRRVQQARNIQKKRYSEFSSNTQGMKIFTNSDLPQKDIEKYIQLDDSSKEILKLAVDKLNLSARSYFRILKVSRTIADLEGLENVNSNHIKEALTYRL